MVGSAHCSTFQKFARICFDIYNETALTSKDEPFDDKLVAATNFLKSPCKEISTNYPPERCIYQNFSAWWKISESCSRKCKNSEGDCCNAKCVFVESGLNLGENLNKTLFTSWFSKSDVSQDHRILGYIDHCDLIGTKTFFKFSCLQKCSFSSKNHAF